MTDSNFEHAAACGVTGLLSKTTSKEDALREVHAQYSHALFRYAVALTGCTDDAEDAVQEVFLRLARESKRLSRIGSLKSYLYASVRNASYSILRNRQSRENLEQVIIWDAHNRSDDEFGCGSMALRQAFMRLPIEQREVVALKVFDGMTFEEIAKTIGVSVNTAASRYRYGVERLRRILEEDDNG